MFQKHTLVFLFVLAISTPCFSKDVTQDQKSVEQHIMEQAEKDVIVMDKSSYLQICRDMYEILKLPENKGYIISRYIKGMNLYRNLPKIPASYKDFKPVKWQKSSVEEFKKAAPKRYQEILSNGNYKKPMVVKKAILNIDHKKEKRLIFKIKPDPTMDLNYMYMDETISDDITESFNKSSVTKNIDAIYYQGLVYFVYLDSFAIFDPKIFRDYQPRFYVESICEYNAKEKSK
jgi:hypothetical protein